MERPAQVSPTLWQGVMEGVRKVEARERGYLRMVEPLYAELFPSYLDEIRQDFYRNFALVPNDKGVPSVAPHRGAAFADTWVTQMDDLLDAVEVEWDLDMEEEVEDAHDEGWLMLLWMLELQDATVLDGFLQADLRVPGDGLAFALAASFGGLTFYQRARMWRVNAVEKARQQLRALAVSGATWPEVEALVARVLTEYRNGLTALGLDELYLARQHGEQRALDAVSARLASGIPRLWLTQDDELVCPRCAPLHLTVTELVPILDTHPRCRCFLVPLITAVRAGLGNQQPFASFVRRLTRESAAHSLVEL